MDVGSERGGDEGSQPERTAPGRPTTVTRDGVEYTIRWYRPGDAAGFCSLLETVTGSERDEEWFERLYVDNPYLDHVPLVLATDPGGDVVGVRPFVAFRVRAGDETEIALLTRDTVVHPDHRRRGLFTTTTEVALRRYEAGEPAFVFSHSNANSRPGYRKMGWRYFGRRTRYCRVQDPGRFVEGRTRAGLGRLLGPVAGPLGRGYLRYRDRTGSPRTDVEVTDYSSLPVETLASLYERRPPEPVHPVRDEAYFRWLFSIPTSASPHAYVASEGGEPLAAAVVVRSRARGGLEAAEVAEIVPMDGGRRWRAGLSSVLDRVIEDHADADLVRASAPPVPPSILLARGFLRNDRLPLSALAFRRLKLGLRPLGSGQRLDDDAAWQLHGEPLAEAVPHLWTLA